MEAVWGILFMAVVVFVLGLVYKKRARISKWLNDPDMAASFDPKIRKLNMEHNIAVMTRRLELMNEMDDVVEPDSKTTQGA